MALHPVARAILDQINSQDPLESLPVAEARERMREFARQMGPGEPVALVTDVQIPGPASGAGLTPRAIALRIYTPASPGARGAPSELSDTSGLPSATGSGALPILVHFHPGGWTVGDLDTDDQYCRSIANAAGCLVVSVNYRHGPEHRFPAAVDDAYAATCWISANAGRFDGDGSRLAVGGASAGGNLAAVVSILARDRDGPRIAYQVLTVPATDSGFNTLSHTENGTGYGLTRPAMEWFLSNYISSPAEISDPRVSPLRTPDLSRLPPAFVQTAQYDPLRDEGFAYAQRLREAGVAVDYRCYDGMIHMFLGPEAIPDAASRLRQAFGLGGHSPTTGPMQ